MSEPTNDVKVTLGEVFRTVQRIEQVLLVGNGEAPITSKVAKIEARIDTIHDLLNYDRGQIDTLRAIPKQARVEAGRWGAASGGAVAIVTGVILAVAEAMAKK